MFICYIANDDVYEDYVLEHKGSVELETKREVSEAIDEWIAENLTNEDIQSYQENEDIVTFNVLNTDTKEIKTVHFRAVIKVVPFFVGNFIKD